MFSFKEQEEQCFESRKRAVKISMKGTKHFDGKFVDISLLKNRIAHLFTRRLTRIGFETFPDVTYLNLCRSLDNFARFHLAREEAIAEMIAKSRNESFSSASTSLERRLKGNEE